METQIYSIHAVESLVELQSDIVNGLKAEDAQERLGTYGPNSLKTEKRRSLILRIFDRFKNFLILVLILAAVVSAIFGDGLRDAIIIISILVIHMIVGLIHEGRANNALHKLRNMSNPKAKVKRDGEIVKIDISEVVLGDIVILSAGDYIPADVRLIESVNLIIDESSLTGQPNQVRKDSDVVLDEDVPLEDRVNLAFMGTSVSYGRGTGVVYATGMDTEIGNIAVLHKEPDASKTPVQEKLKSMAKSIGILCIIASAFVFLIALLYNFIGFGEMRDLIEMMMVSVGLAFASVPEGIVLLATVILAIGVQKMVKSRAIVKKIKTVETLGSTTVICSDKTGTLTQNKMTVIKVCDSENLYEVTGIGYKAKGQVISDGVPSRNITLMAEIGTLCNDAEYNAKSEMITGDPTEGAILVFSAKMGHNKNALGEMHRRIQEIPFDSDRKMMSTYNAHGDAVIMNTKGAPEAIISRCSSLYLDGEVIPMSETLREKLLRQNEKLASEALRVLAFAYKRYQNVSAIDNVEDNLTFVGMMCMIDPPREEVTESIKQCHSAGINVKMITGDHRTTALAIAIAMGISRQDGEVIDGNDMDNLSDSELREKVARVNVYARVSPEHKVRIVSAIKANGNIVAMTGDGVNDAPSLKKADIGIAMGITGTDVSKEAADMILIDDNFASIVSAVRQGRTVYSNLRKVAGYLLGCNFALILIIVLAIAFGLQTPLVATQLLLINLLADVFTGFALGVDKAEEGVMRRKPRNPKEAIINRKMMKSALIRAGLITASSLAAFLYGLYGTVAPTGVSQHILAMSLCFFTLIICQILVAYPSKTEVFTGSVRNYFRNAILNITTLIALVIVFSIMYVPALSDMFGIVPLGPIHVIVCLVLVLISVVGFEASKPR